MFGKKQVKKVEEKPVAVPTTSETPDLIVQKPNMGMPGFHSDEAPQTMPAHTETGIPGFGSIGAPVAEKQATVAAPTPAPVPEVKEQYQIIAAEVVGEGLIRYTIVTNKNLGEVGGVYDA